MQAAKRSAIPSRRSIADSSNILDGKGKIVRETKLPTDPEIIARFIADTGLAIERIGLESGCTAAWLFAGLQRYGWPVICIDARHAAAALQAGFRNKNDRNELAASPI
jgi:transposase